MVRRVFYSFHYQPDCWRVSQVRNIGAIEGNATASDNDWESITRGGDTAIERWIDGQLSGRSCTVVLIGSQTAGRKWIKYEIKKSWSDGKGLVGIYIHGLKVPNQILAVPKGTNPFAAFNVNGTPLANIVKAYDPGTDSKSAYKWISDNLAAAIDEAIAIRNRY
jgi:hypothetical protein